MGAYWGRAMDSFDVILLVATAIGLAVFLVLLES
jgi:hypothetical protein